MKILFDDDFDASVWTGARKPGSGRFGYIELGPLGFLDMVEGRLGLSAPIHADSLRSASLIQPLRAQEGFWSVSADVDPFSAADTLLRWRDRLSMGGWRGEACSPRIAELAAVCAELEPGMPDRLASATWTLAKKSTDIEEVTLLAPTSTLPLLWRRLFDALEKSGTRIEVRRVESPKGGEDRARALARPFSPAGDGSLRLVRPQGPIVAAEMAAAWLASDCGVGDIVIGADPLLDAALHRFGLPATGGQRFDRDPLLEVLPLVIDLGWNPPDPRRVMELLSLPRSPVPRGIAFRLAWALRKWPALGSDLWNEALAKGLEAVESADRRAAITQRLDRLFAATVEGTSFPVAELESRVARTLEWLRGNLASAGDLEGKRWDAAITEAESFRTLVSLSGLAGLSRPQLARLLARVRDRSHRGAGFPAQAGIAGIEGPGAIVGPARRILWWNFTRASVPVVRELPLTREESSALAAAGIELREATHEASRRRSGWHRPFAMAQGDIILVCPTLDDSGTAASLHPLWDEIVANAGGKEEAVSALLSPDLKGAITLESAKIPHVSLPGRRSDWRLPQGLEIQRREVESPTGAEKLVGCPFKWLLEMKAEIKPGASSSLPGLDSATIGTLAHEILERTLRDGRFLASEKGAVGIIAQELLKTEGPRLVAELFVPGGEARLAGLRLVLAAAAEALRDLITKAGATGIEIEQEASCPALGTTLTGRPDIVFGQPPRVIDLKFSGAPYRRQELAAGAAAQLAAYAHLKGKDGNPTPAAFFIISLQRLLTTTAEAFGAEFRIDGPDLAASWEAFAAAYDARFGEFAMGAAASPGGLDEPYTKGEKEKKTDGKKSIEAGILGGRLVLPPPCRFCDYGRLCGLKLEEA